MRVTYQFNLKTYRLYPLQFLQVDVIPLIFDHHNHPSRYNRPPPTQRIWSDSPSNILQLWWLESCQKKDPLTNEGWEELLQKLFSRHPQTHMTLYSQESTILKSERRKVVHLKIILGKKYADWDPNE